MRCNCLCAPARSFPLRHAAIAEQRAWWRLRSDRLGFLWLLGESERDLSSQLLKKLDRYLSHKDATLAFDEVLTALPELALDSPDAVPAVGKFIARSILDGLLPCSYLESGGTAAGTPGPADTLVSAALLTAAGLMSQSCDAVERVWTNVGPYS